MSSSEDYLDKLLAGVLEQDAEKEAQRAAKEAEKKAAEEAARLAAEEAERKAAEEEAARLAAEEAERKAAEEEAARLAAEEAERKAAEEEAARLAAEEAEKIAAEEEATRRAAEEAEKIAAEEEAARLAAEEAEKIAAEEEAARLLAENEVAEENLTESVDVPNLENIDLVSDAFGEHEYSDEIPTDVDTMGVVINSAPSLDPVQPESLDSEIADLMADIMPSFDAGLDSASIEAAERLNSIVMPDPNPVMEKNEALEDLLKFKQSVNDFDVDFNDILNQIESDSLEEASGDPVEESMVEPAENGAEATDPFDQTDIDALLAGIEGSEEVGEEAFGDSVEEPMVEPAENVTETTDPFDQTDIDALLAGIEESNEPVENADVSTDTFNQADIDALLSGIEESNEPVENADVSTEPFDQTDIDALLAGIEGSEEVSEESVEEPAVELTENASEATGTFDQSDIDALLAGIEDSEEPVENADASIEPFDQTDIDALLAGIEDSEEPVAEAAANNTEATDTFDQADIDALLAGIEDSEEPVAETAANNTEANDTFDQTDIDALLAGIEDSEEPVAEPTGDLAESTDSFDQSDIDAIRAELDSNFEDESDLALGEDDIEKMLAQAREGKDETDSAPDEMNLEELLNTSNDGQVDAISELLEKADNNEAVDAGIAELLSGDSDLTNLLNGEGEEVEDEKAKKARLKAEKKAEKERIKAEKLEAKRKAKEEKAAAKAAKKAANNGQTNGDNSVENVAGLDIAGFNPSEESEFDDMKALLQESNIDVPTEESHEPAHSDRVEMNENSIGFDTEIDDIFSEFNLDGSLENGEDNGNLDGAGESNDLGISFDSSENGADQEDVDKEKKPGFLDKIKNFFKKIGSSLAEEDEEDKPSEIVLSEENAQVLEELDKEGDGGKKKKGKKAKKGKDSGKEEAANPDEVPEKKEKKPKKAKKPKKEKPAGDEKPSKKLPVKNVVAIVAVCVVFAAVIFLIINFSGDYSVKREAKRAYLEEDYQTCYQDLYGKKLNEEQTTMFNRSECILRIRLWLREYEILTEEGSEVKALDSLIQSVNNYPGLYISAVENNCIDKVEPSYNEMISILSSKYGLTPEDAIAIASEPDDVTYTRIVTGIANGSSYQETLDKINGISVEVPTETIETIPELQDKLPEEESLSGNSFVEPN